MSLILDALKKAESERARGALPGLATSQVHSTRYIAHGGRSPAVWLGVAAAVAVGAGAAWFWHARVSLPPGAAESTRPGPAVVAQPAARAPAVSATAVEPVPMSVPAATPVAASTVAAVRATPPAPAAVVATPTPAGAAIPALGELPESLRRQLPPIAISGAVYSDAPPQWTLVVNDQVLGRGGQVAPELLLEEVSASSAVFNFRGQRFRIDR